MPASTIPESHAKRETVGGVKQAVRTFFNLAHK
jgi:hypothetical protein